ncbi:hypothetical protein BAU06_09875 [Bordetella bronchialis]|uniref:Uncharacterized protein n=2 Tax=Bordetella bronchialis TaxID=463025 RepID=A0ABN4QZS4_9BORD|nr:hypothetical protein BAU06_09875 [Bordetella bronchialis]
MSARPDAERDNMNPSIDTGPDAQGLFTGVRTGPLALGFCLAAVLALSVHAAMLQLLHVPYPSERLTAFLPEAINTMLMMWGALWLARCLHKRFPQRSLMFRAGILLLLVSTLNETLRGWFMNGYCASAPHAWAYFAISALPRLAPYAVVALVASGAGPRLAHGWQRGVGAAVLGLALALAMPSLSAWLDSAVVVRFQDWAPTEGWCQLPYGWKVVLPAYLTFIAEPALACLFCMACAAPALPAKGLARPMAFMLMILALKKQLLMAVFYAVYSSMPALTALASMGQFSLEFAILGFLVAVSWDHAARSRPGATAAVRH